ncbi:hypothetical protein [Algoriphagus chordae]|uniref:Uncharacterized protein n=1 Tax=Algoriphagus chordae TaxID=237019 RepID=A0A2W7QW33_9BACT|nr:hypothetical protein [Algoriphagus chordae]PZX52494.1 hypothetical protein LV85_01795 [Algoriphagus chordae]
MILQVTTGLKFNELIQTLKSQFPGYTVYSFDSIPQKSIIVRKSFMIGVQLSIGENKIMVEACAPNIFISALLGFLSAILPPYTNFETEISEFLKKKYN